MLHCNKRQTALSRPRLCPFSRHVARVEIVDNGLRLDFECAHQVIERLFEELDRTHIIEVAEVLALIGEPAASEREDVLEMSSDGEQRRHVEWQLHGKRNEAPGPANDLRRAINYGGYGIVAALQDFAIVHQEH